MNTHNNKLTENIEYNLRHKEVWKVLDWATTCGKSSMLAGTHLQFPKVMGPTEIQHPSSGLSFAYKTTVPLGQDLSLLASFNPSHLPRILFPNTPVGLPSFLSMNIILQYKISQKVKP